MAFRNPQLSSSLTSTIAYIVVESPNTLFSTVFEGLLNKAPKAPNGSIQFREFSIKKGKDKSHGKIEEVAIFDFENMKGNEYMEKVESVVELFPVLLVDRHYRRSISAFYDHPTGLPEKLFYLKLIGKGKVVYPLYSRETFRLIAIKSGDKVMALQTEEEFSEIANHLVDKEGIKKEKIVFNPMQFDSDSVQYNLSKIVDSVNTLSMLNDEPDTYKYTQCLNRISGFGYSFVLRDWSWFFFVLFIKSNRRGKFPTPRMSVVRDKWTEISQYVHSGGKSSVDVENVKITLNKVKKILYIVHSKSHSPEEKFLKKIGPNPPKILWKNPKPGEIVPNSRSGFSAFYVPFRRGISSGPVFHLPGRGIGTELCGSRTGPLGPFLGSKFFFSAAAPRFLTLLRKY